MDTAAVPVSAVPSAGSHPDAQPYVEMFDGDAVSPPGFAASGVHCGLKRKRPDLALLSSECPAAAAAVFTTNRVPAAPVLYSRRAILGGRTRSIVVNSGNANACTGVRGEDDAAEMARLAARATGAHPREVLVASTGLIGVRLPMEKIRQGIRAAGQALRDPRDPGHGGAAAASAILTTDRFTKTAAARVDLDGTVVTIGGMAKGAGMVHPRMATTLGFLTTDASVPVPVLQAALRDAAGASFNAITVDGETSTNDALFLLANGLSGARPLEGAEAIRRFTRGLTLVAGTLARMVVRDGEGATKLVTIRVEGAVTDAQARKAADRLAGSLLVKTALFGEEPNWGRIMAALGSAGIEVEPSRIDVAFGETLVARNGVGRPEALAAAEAHLEGDEVTVRVALGLGVGTATVWTCDLGHEYVRINGSYAS